MTTASAGDEMDGHVEELEPLFDYSHVQPLDVISLDEDDSLEAFPICLGKKRKGKDVEIGKTRYEIVNLDDDGDDGDGGCNARGDSDDKDDDDWLAPPPKIAKLATHFKENQILKELRLKKQELASLAHAQSAENIVKEVIEIAKREHGHAVNCLADSASEKSKYKETYSERQKIIISMQDKDGSKQFRVYKDDMLKKLFKMYADKANMEMTRLVFCFDGETVQPTATPTSLGLEEDDIIEVHHKS